MTSERQTGFTLIELMVGIVVGLIVLSAVIYAFISSLRSSADILNSARLNREVSSLSDILVGEMRRVGYWPVSTASPFGVNPDLSLLPDSAAGVDATCVLYSYYNDADSPAVQIYRGIAVESGTLYYGDLASDAISTLTSCDPLSGGWDELSNPDFLTVNSFNVSLDCSDVLSSSSVAYASCKTTAGDTYSRSLNFTLDVKLTRDEAWSSEINQTVKLQNDLSD